MNSAAPNSCVPLFWQTHAYSSFPNSQTLLVIMLYQAFMLLWNSKIFSDEKSWEGRAEITIEPDILNWLPDCSLADFSVQYLMSKAECHHVSLKQMNRENR